MPAAQSRVVQVLLIDTFTHFCFYPALSKRSLSVSEVYWNTRVFQWWRFDIELSISLVEASPVLWDKTDGIYKDWIETRNEWAEVCTCLQEDFEALGEVKKKLLVSIAVIYWTQLIEMHTNLPSFIVCSQMFTFLTFAKEIIVHFIPYTVRC